MKRVIERSFVICSLLTVFVGCNSPNPSVGAGIAAGAIVGVAVAASSMEPGDLVIPEAHISGKLGGYMDQDDRVRLAHILYTKSSMVREKWVNAKSHIEFEIRPYESFYALENKNQPCRDFMAIVISQHRTERIASHACRVPLGHWYS